MCSLDASTCAAWCWLVLVVMMMMMLTSPQNDRHTVSANLRQGHPHAFQFKGLQPKRRYAVAFDGVDNSRKRPGTVTTMSYCPITVNVVGISGSIEPWTDTGKQRCHPPSVT